MGNGRRKGRGRGIGKRTMGGCNCPCGSILLCGVALIIHVSINCHFVVIVVHTPFSQSPSLPLSLNTLTRGAAASVRIDFEVPRRISSFCSPSFPYAMINPHEMLSELFDGHVDWLKISVVFSAQFAVINSCVILCLLLVSCLFSCAHNHSWALQMAALLLGLSRAKVSSRHLSKTI